MNGYTHPAKTGSLFKKALGDSRAFSHHNASYSKNTYIEDKDLGSRPAAAPALTVDRQPSVQLTLYTQPGPRTYTDVEFEEITNILEVHVEHIVIDTATVSGSPVATGNVRFQLNQSRKENMSTSERGRWDLNYTNEFRIPVIYEGNHIIYNPLETRKIWSNRLPRDMRRLSFKIVDDNDNEVDYTSVTFYFCIYTESWQ